jgi:hypothetical protein
MSNSARVPQIDRSEVLALAERVECGGAAKEDGPLFASLLRHLVRLTDELRNPSREHRRTSRAAPTCIQLGQRRTPREPRSGKRGGRRLGGPFR